VLASRLALVADATINPCENEFIKCRQILDGVVVIEEILHELKFRKKKGIVLKLDFEKAYDRVDWEFLEEMLEKGGLILFG
jgi:hypothetical protein